MQQAQQIWNAALKSLGELVDSDTFERYFSDIVPVALDVEGGRFTLGVTNDLIAFWLNDNFGDILEVALRQATDHPLEVILESGHQPAPAVPVTAVPPLAPMVTERMRSNGQQQIGAQERSQNNSETGKLRQAANSNIHIADSSHHEDTTPCRGDFSFESFVVGNSNKICFAAAKAVSEKPGQAYNPLLIYGGVALGKTHLLQAIANNVVSRRKRAKVLYVTSEEFVNQYVEAIQTKKLTEFRKRFRSVDVLLLDDIQFLEGKVGSSEEFFHTFNTLHNNHKQLVLACDRTPQEISGLEQRLVSRFEWGLSAEVLSPDFETRLAILRSKQEKQQIKLPDDVLNLIAEQIHSNIRNLESALTRLIMNVSAFSDTMTIERAKELLKDKFEQERGPQVTIDRIQKHVAEHFDISRGDMMSKKRPRKIAVPRMVAMYLSRKLTSDSLPAIGDAFNRNHATVIHAVDKVEELMERDETLRTSVMTLRRHLEA